MTQNGGQDFRDASMLHLFAMEAEMQTTVLNDGLLTLERDAQNAESLEALMRAAHSLKGAARIVQLSAAERVAHVMEDSFVAAQEGRIVLNSDAIEVLLQGADMLTRLSEMAETASTDDIAGLQSELDPLVASISGIAAPGAAPPSALSQPASSPASPPPPPPASPVTSAPPEPAAPPAVPPVASAPPEPAPVSAPSVLQDASMLHLFAMEAEMQTTVLSDGLLTLERDPRHAESLEALMRAAHSLKGAARIVQLNAAERVAHVMEDSFVAAQEGRVVLDSNAIEALLQGADMLTRLSQISETSATGDLAGLQAELDTLVGSIAGIVNPGAAPAPVPAPAPTLPDAPLPPQDVMEDMVEVVETMPVPAEHMPVPAAQPERPAPVASRDTPAPSRALRDDAERDRVVRVSADNLNRLMGLAGESLVESKWLEPFGMSLRQLKRSEVELSGILEQLREALVDMDVSERVSQALSAARRKVDENRHQLSDRLAELELFARRSENLSDRLYREAIASRMRPFDDGVQGFPRMVRDIARKLGKKVKFEIAGRTTEVDRDILERLEAPLSHLLRNAIDHGIEPPADRLAAGKSEEGTICLEAGHRGGMLSITITDDGRGVELDTLRQKIVSKQLTTGEMAASLTEAELMEFLFLPAFSTTDKVTEISGRGVGLDVVHEMAQEVGGTVRAVSDPGRGMAFFLQMPLTLSVLRTLLVEIAGEPYAFPLARIDHAVMLPKDGIEVVSDRQYFTLDGHHIGLVMAYQVLEAEGPDEIEDTFPVVVLSDRLNRYGLVVDRFLGESDLVVQPLDPRLGKVPDISAAALMEDGSPILIIDVEDMVRSVDNLLTGRRLRKVDQTADALIGPKRKRILVVDDSITVREVERQLLTNNGYEVEVAVDGMDGWNAVRAGHYDLVISDVDMPRMNGIELVSQIKGHTQFQSVPVMIVSYKGSDEDRNRGLEAGANYYLSKSSFHDETLLHAVVDLIGEA